MRIAFLAICVASGLTGAVQDPVKSAASDPPAAAAASAGPDVPAPPKEVEGGASAANRAVTPVVVSRPPEKVDWSGLSRGSLRFIGVMQAFRVATEPGTRAGGFGLGKGYTSSVASLHGWADGDPFYVNYVGHPMQGAVTNHLWQLSDNRFRRAEFGRSREYWKSKLRGAAFAWAFSEQFEIGPVSEASIGHIQRDFPQQGFVDHVVTPTVGLAWTLAEDALDRYVVRRIEDSTENRWVRLAARSFLNPARAFANAMDWRPPWYRTSRAGILSYRASEESAQANNSVRSPAGELPDTAVLEVVPVAVWRQFGSKACVGGGAEAAWRFAPEWQLLATVSGCKLFGLAENVTADSLVYQLGPRWTPSPEGKWSPYAHLLIGGMKVTQESFDPVLKRVVTAANQNLPAALSYTLHDQYTAMQEANALALTAGAGIDYKLNDALALRIANVEYLRSRAPSIGNVPYGSGFQMSAGMVLRLGTW